MTDDEKRPNCECIESGIILVEKPLWGYKSWENHEFTYCPNCGRRL
jgi:hypothetical protein